MHAGLTPPAGALHNRGPMSTTPGAGGASPAVSVLVPCFRSAAFLPRALDALLAQTFGDWEAVVVDNASDDATLEVAQAYARRDPRIRVERNATNVGPVRNWRRCAELARAPLAGLCFSDDWYEPAYLARLVPRLADPGVGLAWSAVRMNRGGPEARPATWYQLPDGDQAAADYLRAIYHGRPAVPWSPCCAVMRAGDLRRWLSVELPDEARHGWLRHGAGPDLWIWLQACRDYPRLSHVAEPLVDFLDHAGNLSKGTEARAAYAVALLAFWEAFPGVAGLPEAELQAALWRQLRGNPARARVRSRLGAAGWWAVATQAARRRLGLRRW